MPLKILISLGLLMATTARADILRVDDAIDLKSGGITVVRAFHSNNNCRVWQYVPGSLIASGSFKQNTGVRPNIYGTEVLPAFTTALSLVTHSRISSSVLSQLQSEIYRKITNLSPSDPCYQSVDKLEQIILSPAMVLSKAINETEADRNYYQNISPIFGAQDTTTYFDPTNPNVVTYSLDTSDPETKNRLSQLIYQSKNRPQRIGDIGYFVDGVIGHIDSKYSVSGKYSAAFESRVQAMGCTEKAESVKIAGAVLSGAPIGLLGSISRKTKVCVSQLLTNLVGSSADAKFEIDDSRSRFQVDGKDIRGLFCDDPANCEEMSLRDYVHQELLNSLVFTNFSLLITKLADSTLVITLGRSGPVNSTFKFESTMKMNLEGKFGFKIPVYASQLDPMSFDLSQLNRPKILCAQANYDDQVDKYYEYGSLLPMPIADVCRTKKVSNDQP